MKNLRIFIQATYIILFIITSYFMLHALQNNYEPSTLLLILYHISAFLSVGKCIYCWVTGYLNQ